MAATTTPTTHHRNVSLKLGIGGPRLSGLRIRCARKAASRVRNMSFKNQVDEVGRAQVDLQLRRDKGLDVLRNHPELERKGCRHY